jgi:hypothetical protein
LEVLGAVALLVPKLAATAASMLFVIMLGALVTHVRHGETGRVPEVLILALLLGVVVHLRRRDALGRAAVRHLEANQPQGPSSLPPSYDQPSAG